MNILKILGIVVAVHVVAFFLMFVNPGCRSSSPRPAPADTSAAPSGLSPATASVDFAPAVSVNIPPPVGVRYSPTRPGTPAAAALESAPPADVTPATTYTVVAGDSLWKIARKHGTTVAELEKANKLTSNSRLSVGQKLIIPGKAPAGAAGSADPGMAATYTVKPGDTLASIARRVGSTTAELKQANSLRSDYVRVGQELKLPTSAALKMDETTASPAVATPVKKPEGAMTHVVKAGETLGAIARKYQVKVSDLAVANNIADPKKIRPGQELVIPGFTAVGGAAPAPQSAPAAIATQPATPATPLDATTPAVTTPPPPPPGQDLDSGLKPQGDVPVIKIDDTGATESP
ncbi:MAG: LysM peptidoglycan-binding domain-containing protein [Opitutaceae bacterium]|nr:LysM peptidoglycan-binding domain-containing protein [Opitutaceae bacterium]